MTDRPVTPCTNSVSLKLLDRLSEELLTPLTSILGMASVLSQEIYGPLTPKQKEYVDILNERGRYLRSLAEEIVALAKLTDNGLKLARTAVDPDNLCQQAIASLEPVASRKQVKITLERGLRDSINPENSGSQLQLLDRNIFQQMLQNLLLSVIETADADSIIKLHLSRKEQELALALWMSHPVLEESLPHSQLYRDKLSALEETAPPAGNSSTFAPVLNRVKLASSELGEAVFEGVPPEANATASKSPELLRLLLACQLLELQGGTLSIQGSPDLGYRYLLSFPFNNG